MKVMFDTVQVTFVKTDNKMRCQVSKVTEH